MGASSTPTRGSRGLPDGFAVTRRRTGRVRRPVAHRALGRNYDGLVCAYRPHTTPALLRAKARLALRARYTFLLSRSRQEAPTGVFIQAEKEAAEPRRKTSAPANLAE